MEEPEMKTIDVIICRLRKKLAVAGVPTLIDTVWGCGYILRDPSVAPEVMAVQPAWASRVAVAA
jgi:two-component system cell cycle response regulator CtrA